MDLTAQHGPLHLNDSKLGVETTRRVQGVHESLLFIMGQAQRCFHVAGVQGELPKSGG